MVTFGVGVTGRKHKGFLEDCNVFEISAAYMHEVCPESIHPCNMKNRDIYWSHKPQETLYIGQWGLSPLQIRYLRTSHSSPDCSTVFLLLWEQKLWNKFCYEMFHAKILHQNLRHHSFGIPRWASSSRTVSHWSLLNAAHTCSTFLGVLFFAGLLEHGSLSTDSWPSLRHLCHTFIWAALIASSPKAFWIIWIVSFEECSSLTQNVMQICCSTHSVILNAMATQYTCLFKSVYWPLWLVQWSCRCSHKCIPVHSSWLPGYIDVTCANNSCYINNGWTFSRQTSCIKPTERKF